jgi:hypothetical protein
MRLKSVWVLLLAGLAMAALPGCSASSEPCPDGQARSNEGACVPIGGDDDDSLAGELCDDGADNDGDGHIDCDDQDCEDEPACAGDDDSASGDDDTGDDDTGDDDTGDDDTGDDDTGELDADSDGYSPDDGDCDDDDPTVYPAADELCDSTDHDCDGDPAAGAVDAPTWYQDTDGDGFGTDTSSQVACSQPHGFSAYRGDCNDNDPSYHPGATEADCTDPADYNCDLSVGYADVDGDGHAACEDCDDNNAAANPAATEACNGIDDNCDGQTDEAGATGETPWYLDADGDSYGRTTLSTLACAQPLGYVANSGDCDDLDASSYPGGTEVCDEADNNCDGAVDEGVTTTFFGDSDGDGYGSPGAPLSACFLPAGASVNQDDCDDGQAAAHPGGVEVCDGLDNDCDGSTDVGAINATTWYTDADGDGFGDPLTGLSSCSVVSGAVVNGLDCDDGDGGNFPGNVETCDGADDDCDYSVDESFDGDGDGVTICGSDGILGNGDDDCDDTDPSLYPGNAESCDALDDNCDGIADEGLDADGDGVTPCGVDGIPGNGDDDCDDGDAANFPGNTEICDGGNNDCDFQSDEGFDIDGDGVSTCGLDGIIGSVDDDCDDGAADNFPGNNESCDGNDQDCDGVVDNGFDGDGDGITTCGPDGVAGNGDDDCDDSSAAVSTPGQSSTCPVSSCAVLLSSGPAPANGNYWIDPSGGSPFEAYCEMSLGGGGWTMLLNLDTSDGHVMWWADPLWTDSATHGDVSSPFAGDHKSRAFMDLSAANSLLLMVHENGAVLGWKSFALAGTGSLSSYLQGGDNTQLGSSVIASDTASVWTGERLVRDSTSLFANHCVQTGGGCVTSSGGSPDGDRIGSNQGTPSDNNGGGLGNWHDMGYCCSGQNYAGHGCNGSAFRTTSEAQAGWVYTGQTGTFGSDTFGAMTGTQNNSGCSNANWAIGNGFDYDYAIFFGP